MWREKAIAEARAKIFWGEDAATVIAYLQSEGMPQADAAAIIDSLLKERAENVRASARRGILIGVPLIFIPVAAYFGMESMHFLSLKVLAATVIIGLYGIWKVVRGIVLNFSPHSETGDLSGGT